MKTEVLTIDPHSPQPDRIARAAEVLRAGGLVAFPTETVYGLGANALSEEAVRRIFEAKGRPANNPLIVHVADLSVAQSITAEWPPAADALARAFWPGPLALILPRRPCIPDVVTGGGSTVAVRVPAHRVALDLLRAANMPIAAPSANRSNHLSPTRAEHVLRGLEGRIDLILDGGPTTGGLESTVVDVSVQPPQLLRPGLLPPGILETYLGPVVRAQRTRRQGELLPAPGMLQRHYAPRTPLECNDDDGWERVRTLTAQGLKVGWMTLAGKSVEETSGVDVRCMPTRAEDYGSQLFAVLHELDQAHLDRIVVELPPATEEWLAVRDRLLRAATTD